MVNLLTQRDTINYIRENCGLRLALYRGVKLSKQDAPRIRVPEEICGAIYFFACPYLNFPLFPFPGQGHTDVPGFQLPNVETLIWGQTVSGTVERQNAHFFKITITEEDLKNGVIISCSSTGNDKFKVGIHSLRENVMLAAGLIKGFLVTQNFLKY